MNEAKERAKLVKRLRQAMPAATVFRHEDVITAGIPDISVSLNRKTIWLETKANALKTTGLQFENLRRLKGFYIVFNHDTILIADPLIGSVTTMSLTEVVDWVKGMFS
jgi:hypothetical protein